jgi:hypothetical protein
MLLLMVWAVQGDETRESNGRIEAVQAETTVAASVQLRPRFAVKPSGMTAR